MKQSTRILLIASAAVLVAGGIAAGLYLQAVSHLRRTFVVYYSETTTASEVQALGGRISHMPGVASVTYLDANAALASVKSEMAARPDDFIPQTEGPGPLLGALDIHMSPLVNGWATPRVVRAIERDPSFQGVSGLPNPPGGWIVPLR